MNETDVPLIDIICGAYHEARCLRPDDCGATCPHRMPVDVGVAVHQAVVSHLDTTALRGYRLVREDDLRALMDHTDDNWTDEYEGLQVRQRVEAILT